jgi:hypothetical protein
LSNWNVDAQHQLQQDIRREETDPTSRIQSTSDRGVVGDAGKTGYAMADPFETPNMDLLVEISGLINPKGKFTEEYRVPAELADPSIAQGPVGWYPENWARLSKSEYPFIPSDLGGHYISSGPEGDPSIVYSMEQTAMYPPPEERAVKMGEDFRHSNLHDPNAHYQKHERYHEAGHILNQNMDWWKDVKVRGEPLQDVLAPDGKWDRELFHSVMYATSPSRRKRLTSLGEKYGKHEFFKGEEEGLEQLLKLQDLTNAIDEAAGKVYEAFIAGQTKEKTPQGFTKYSTWNWGKGAVGEYSEEQGLKEYYLED